MTDTPTGLAVNFSDYQDGAFVQTTVASGLDRSLTHTIKLTMFFVDGAANDIVKVYVDGSFYITRARAGRTASATSRRIRRGLWIRSSSARVEPQLLRRSGTASWSTT